MAAKEVFDFYYGLYFLCNNNNSSNCCIVYASFCTNAEKDKFGILYYSLIYFL